MSIVPQIGGDELARLVEEVLRRLGEDPTREGLLGTPERVARSLRYLTEGYDLDVRDAVGDALFEQDYDEVVAVRDIQFYSLCEHHLLPFFGVAHVAYLPRGRVLGLSKIPRLVDLHAHRLQLQERMTRQIAESLEEVVRPDGVAVVVEARHLCMEMRGVEKAGSQTVTSCMLGCFRTDARSRAEVLSLLRTRS
ncbi:MAG TPA: GTP cyclohydrolase I FolE [Candidatus Dormibacteraeota bacterium]|jgi:GTP cyclohydrolase I|nr:GTP cyclohydrolase I FolE [Candidatus Dormibacteraeota bacterium]